MKKLVAAGCRLLMRHKIWICLGVMVVPLAILLVTTWKSADANTRFGVVAAITGLMGTVVGASITHYQAKKREIEARHFAEKQKAYLGFIDLFFAMAGHGSKLNQHQLKNKMLEFKKALLIWGSSDFLKLWHLIEENPSGEAASVEALRRIDEILRRIRPKFQRL